jgi:hypothetical protein
MDTRWRSSVSEMMDIWLPAKGNWLLGSIGGITTADELAVFLLGAISILPASRVGGEWQRGFGSGKARTRARKAKAAKSAALMGYSRARYRFKSAQSSPGGYFQNPSMPRGNPTVISRTPVRHLITRPSSSKWLARPAITQRRLQNADFVFSRSALLLKCRRRLPVGWRCLRNTDIAFQSLGVNSKKMLTSRSNHSALTLKR